MTQTLSELDPAPMPLMAEAVKVHNIDTAEAPEGLLRLADARCRRCRNGDACFAWLNGMRESRDYRWFCPNAVLFDGLPKARVH